ncbi:MAG: histidinol-phosphate transaminase [Chloroflexi bacterium]|nr:histidinol-phosphate transaminase [Chloroflexota bacterium]
MNPNLLNVPPYIGGKPIEEVQDEYGLRDIVKIASNENAFGPSPRALASFHHSLPHAHRYPGIADRRLRQKLAKRFNAQHSANFTEANFMTGNGLTDVLRMLALTFIYDGGESVFCTPTFPLYSIYTRMFGGKAVAVPHKNYSHDLPAMLDAINDNTRLVFVCNPNNPTGTLITRDQVETFVRHVPQTALIVFDEAYFDFVQDGNYSNSVEYVQEQVPNVMVLRSFSKSYGLANLRLGYALTSTAIIDHLSRAQIAFNTSDQVLHAGIAALDDDEYLDYVRKQLFVEKKFLYDGLAALDLTYVPTETNFILLTHLPREVKHINEEMLRRGVIIRPMGGFGMPDAIRITIGTREENERFLNAMRDVLKQ